MGFRYRKSINLGGGFRINLSKSGVGYSWGAKGYRVTKTASGKTRTTASIPGTGLSYVQEFGGKKSNKHFAKPAKQGKNVVTAIDNEYYDTEEFKNADVRSIVSDGLEEMLISANRALKFYSWAAIGVWTSLVLGLFNPVFLILCLICAGLAFYIRKTGVIDMEYTFEADQEAEVNARMKPLIGIAKSKKLWWISERSKVRDNKYHAGASTSSKRNKCKATTKAPFPFKTNSIAVTFSSGKETLLFLPDKLFVIQGTKIGALNYSDVTTTVHGQRFIERETVPKDAQIVDYTWEYVNKSGGKDKRFKNNKQLPICYYGEIEIRSSLGVNSDIMFSNINIEH